MLINILLVALSPLAGSSWAAGGVSRPWTALVRANLPVGFTGPAGIVSGRVEKAPDTFMDGFAEKIGEVLRMPPQGFAELPPTERRRLLARHFQAQAAGMAALAQAAFQKYAQEPTDPEEIRLAYIGARTINQEVYYCPEQSERIRMDRVVDALRRQHEAAASARVASAAEEMAAFLGVKKAGPSLDDGQEASAARSGLRGSLKRLMTMIENDAARGETGEPYAEAWKTLSVWKGIIDTEAQPGDVFAGLEETLERYRGTVASDPVMEEGERALRLESAKAVSGWMSQLRRLSGAPAADGEDERFMKAAILGTRILSFVAQTARANAAEGWDELRDLWIPLSAELRGLMVRRVPTREEVAEYSQRAEPVLKRLEAGIGLRASDAARVQALSEVQALRALLRELSEEPKSPAEQDGRVLRVLSKAGVTQSGARRVADILRRPQVEREQLLSAVRSGIEGGFVNAINEQEEEGSPIHALFLLSLRMRLAVLSLDAVTAAPERLERYEGGEPGFWTAFDRMQDGWLALGTGAAPRLVYQTILRATALMLSLYHEGGFGDGLEAHRDDERALTSDLRLLRRWTQARERAAKEKR